MHAQCTVRVCMRERATEGASERIRVRKQASESECERKRARQNDERERESVRE